MRIPLCDHHAKRRTPSVTLNADLEMFMPDDEASDHIDDDAA